MMTEPEWTTNSSTPSIRTATPSERNQKRSTTNSKKGWRKLRTMLNHILNIDYEMRAMMGEKICPQCGSNNITVRGWAGHNLRHDCHHCGKETRIDLWP